MIRFLSPRRFLFCLCGMLGAFLLSAQPAPATRSDDAWLRAQIELTRLRFSCGPIDGVQGPQTVAALHAFQQSRQLPQTGTIDAETVTQLFTSEEPLSMYTLVPEDFAGLQPLSATWLGKSQQTALAYETVQELVAERTRASPALLQKLNPSVVWDQLKPGATLIIPASEPVPVSVKAAQFHIRLGGHILQVRDAEYRLIAHFPVSIARDVEKRPDGELRVTVAIADPNYTFDPAVFTESAEAREIGRKLILQPGPNNPVGVAWIGLSLDGYGIHGTPKPENVGRTESHGCFRLANWDARTLLAMAWVGLPVVVDP
jgi:lipoprotein-anchoring transpeptidase ErfK/SrfK